MFLFFYESPKRLVHQAFYASRSHVVGGFFLGLLSTEVFESGFKIQNQCFFLSL